MDTRELNTRLNAAPLRTCLTQLEMDKLAYFKGHTGGLKRVFILNGKAMIRLHVGQPFYVGAIRDYAKNVEKVLRYADMAVLHFRRYKLRGSTAEPKFNFSLQRAEKDLEFETALKEILVDLEKELVRGQILPSLDELADRRASDRAKLSANLSRSAKLESTLAEIKTQIDVLTKGMTLLLNELKEKNKHD